MLSTLYNMRLKNVAVLVFMMLVLFFIICWVLQPQDISSISKRDFLLRKKSHRSLSLDQGDVEKLVDMSDMTNFKQNLLNPMLIKRVSGTKENKDVQEHIRLQMGQYGWHIENDQFLDSTPKGRKEFTNIIATQNPVAPRKLVLACHFDSKYFTHFDFIGATDSAVPCAMLLDLARTLTQYLRLNEDFEVSLQFIFFDGEEAFERWTDDDSIYGARHLAAKMQATDVEVLRELVMNRLQTIDALVLLDLIGAPHPKFINWFKKDTGKMFQQMADIEKMLKDNSLLTTDENYKPYFDTKSTYRSGIEDDHIPFLRKKVPILHLIAYPFPRVWHTESDNESALDYPTIDNLNKILRIFIAQYLHLKDLL